MYIIIAIIIFGILVATHELGHFLVAKACGIRVLEYSIGMGPAIFKKQGKETLYSLRILPLGGFCSMEGEDGESEDPRAFVNQNGLKKFLVLVAGAAMNFLFGFLLILLVFSQQSSFMTPTITGFMDGCPYQGEDGLLVGDEFYKINGERIYFSSDVSTYLQRGGKDTADIVLIRDGKKIKLEDYPITLVEYPTEDGGTELKYGLYFGVKEEGALARIKYSWYCALDFVRMVRLSLVDLFTGAVGIKDMSGVVGIVGVMNDVGKASATFADAMLNLAYISALIAINLAVMNLLPIPALDGGRIFFVFLTWLIQKITRRPLDPKYESYINAVCFILLMALMVFILCNDIWKLIK
jgi:regulator of sigma E protease